MEALLSKELLSEVLKSVHKVTSIEDLGNKISYKHITEYDKELHSHINIHELAHKVKEWAWGEGYGIETDYSGWYRIHKDDKYFGVDGETASEIESVVYCGQWILENRNDN